VATGTRFCCARAADMPRYTGTGHAGTKVAARGVHPTASAIRDLPAGRLLRPPPSNLNMLLSAENVTKRYDSGTIYAVDNVSLQLDANDFVAIMGPSGSGKSSLLQLIGGLDHPDSGQIRFRGQPYSRMRDLARFRSHHVGFIFQSFQLLPSLTAIENVELPMFERRITARARRQRAAALLADVGMGTRLSHRPAQLSGGERQRVAVARALANSPALLLADEPTGNLDSHTGKLILDLLLSLRAARGMTILMVTHDASVASHAQRLLHMRDGRLAGRAA
jgi:ABC-type lipoprotein export system ATPase subunit